MDRGAIIRAALDLMDEVGLDGVSTRLLAQRLGVEQPALYWHFRSKKVLLEAMALTAIAPHTGKPLPTGSEPWNEWFAGNARSLRHTLLHYRDGARLHAGSRPDAEDAHRLETKLSFLKVKGFKEEDALMAILGVSRFTLGCVLEEQADENDLQSAKSRNSLDGTGRAVPDHNTAFEAGLAMLIHGFGILQKPDPDTAPQ